MNFRRIMTAMFLLAICVGLASAQVATGPSTGQTAGALTCTANVAVPPQLRSEGLTELIGDIVISCTGGNALAPGSVVPTANITVSLGTNVTSRLLGAGTASNPSNSSEALLLVDEPTTDPTGAHGVGPTAGFNICTNSAVGAGPGGCSQVVSNATAGGTVANPGSGQTATSCSTSGGVTTCTAAVNVFQGLVNANQVTFQGVPVNPPVTGGTARVYRITNVRANVSALGGGGLAGTTQLLASVSISGSTSLPVANPVLVAGFIQSGLTTSLRNVGNTGGGSSANLAQCGGGGPNPLTVLRYQENFGTSFKTRVAPLTNAANSGQLNNLTGQSTPGTIYNSESGLILSGVAGNGNVAGLADFGTRLKAVFNNIPAGVRIFVSTTNVVNDFAAPVSNPNNGQSNTPFAQLILSETAPDSNGFVPAASANATFGGQTTLNITEIPVVNGSATAVWEVVNTNPNLNEFLDFGVWQAFTANPGANSPPTGTGTVNMSYAPTPPIAFTAAAGGAASSSLPIPRFADTSSGTNILSIVLCQTTLLYPYVTNIAGFDTGLAIANTTSDPFGTRTQNGSCNMNFYGTAAPAAVNTGNIATGTVYATLTSTAAPGFNGYMIAVCNFQLAHGFAFISDLGARNLAMGYLALVFHTGTGSRNSGSLAGTAPSNIEAINN